MALTFEFEEEYKSSRSISVTEDSFQQDFVFYICGNFLDEAIDDPSYGPDDDIVALRAAYSMVPPRRIMPLYTGGNILLTLSDLKVDQVDPNTWKVSTSYSARPEDQSPGGMGSGGTGPAVGDRGNWSNNFVQLSFNVGAQQETRTQSIKLVDIKKNSGFGNQNVPHTTGQPAPIGQTINGIEGAPVYIRNFGFSITAYFRPRLLTFNYVRRLYRMATTVNNASFFGFPAGSVLFLEASASGDLYSVVPVTFDFQVRPNYKFSQTLPTALSDPNSDKEVEMFDLYNDPFFPDPNAVTPFPGGAFSGWSVVDYRYMGDVDATAKMNLQKPVLRLIHQMYETSDFSKFRL